MSSKNYAAFALLLAAVLWSLGGVLIKWVDWNPLAIAGGRSIIAAAVIWAAFRKQRLSLSKMQWIGAAAYCLTVILFVAATKLTTAANAILLQYTAPIYVAIFGQWFLGEKTTPKDWLTVCLVFGGIIFFFMDKVTVGNNIGNLCALGSGISFAAFTLAMRRQKDESPYGSVLLGNIITFLFSIPFFSGITLSTSNVTAILLLGVLQLGCAYVLYSYAICRVQALDAMLITSIEPVLNPIWVFLMMGEAPGPYAIVGGIIVVGAIFMRNVLISAPRPKQIES